MSFPYPATDTMTIANGESNSSALSIQQGCSMVKIKAPAALTGTTLTLQGSFDGVNFANVTLDGSVVSFTFSASAVFDVNPRASFGLRSVRLVSDGTEGAERTISAVIAKVL